MTPPLAIDLFCGLGGWSEGLLAEGYRVVGFDVERHRYPAREFSLPEQAGKGMAGRNAHGTTLINAAREQVHGFHTAALTGGWDEYPAQLVLQDVLTIHGRQFKDAALIVASPPCQEYSYMAMPWSRAKAIEADYKAGRRDVKQLTALFDACFRIQREASEAAGRHIPMVVENVRGAQKWVGRSQWNFGSFHLWGDVPALMPMTRKAKVPTMGAGWYPPDHPKHVPGLAFNGHAARALAEGVKAGDRNKGRANGGHEWTTGFDVHVKGAGDGWFNDAKRKGGSETGRLSQSGSKSSARKAASAMIAKIPFVLASWIAQSYYPVEAKQRAV